MNANFWLGSALCTFMVLIIRPFIIIVRRYLDNKVDAIDAKLTEAACIKNEAEEYLHKLKMEYEATTKKCNNIIIQAEDRASRLLEKTEKQMHILRERKEISVKQNIERYEKNILSEMKHILFERALQMVLDALYEDIPKLSKKQIIHDKMKAMLEKCVITGSDI